MSTTPPGWYDDGRGALRWWDGTSWTEHVHTAPDQAPAVSDAAPGPEAAAASPPARQAPADPSAGSGTPAYPAQYPGAPDPGAAPGYPGQPGGPAAPDAPRKKSKLWILWVVLGGVVVLVIVLAVLLIPLVVGWFTSSATTGGSADETRAVQAVELYDDAWDEADCDAYEESTTEAYRESIALTDCTTFEAEARAFGESTDDYELEVTGVEATGEERIEVVTLETYQRLFDDEGEPLDEPQAVEDTLRYVLVPEGDRWVIDGLDYDE
jgi:hypothetical protein